MTNFPQRLNKTTTTKTGSPNKGLCFEPPHWAPRSIKIFCFDFSLCCEEHASLLFLQSLRPT